MDDGARRRRYLATARVAVDFTYEIWAASREEAEEEADRIAEEAARTLTVTPPDGANAEGYELDEHEGYTRYLEDHHDETEAGR